MYHETFESPRTTRSRRRNRGGGGVGENAKISKAAPPPPRKRTVSRSTLVLGDEMERDARGGFPSFREVPSSPFNVMIENHSTPMRGIGIREKSANERNLLTPVSTGKTGGGGLPPFFAPCTPISFKTPGKETEKGSVGYLETPYSSKASGRSELMRTTPQSFHLFGNTPSPSSGRNGATSTAKSMHQSNFTMANNNTLLNPVIHPFWSPSPKRVWSYLITGGVSDFLHCAVANVEDLMELQKNGNVYFTEGAVPFDTPRKVDTVKIKTYQRWNRFSWKVDTYDEKTDTTAKVILILPHSKGEEDIEMKEGLEIHLGPLYQELSNIGIYLKWYVVG